ncbi:MAG: hypothetical protein ACE5JA_02325 [bacterium]
MVIVPPFLFSGHTLSHPDQSTRDADYANLLNAFKAKDIGIMTEFFSSEDPSIRSRAAEAYHALKHICVNVQIIIDSTQRTWEFRVTDEEIAE